MKNLPPNIVLDDKQSVFFGRQLELIETRLYQVKYPDLEAEMLLPSRVPVPVGVDKYMWRMFDKRAGAVPMAGHEDGAPHADLDGDEQSAIMQSWVSGYGYNVEEIAAAAFAGVPVEQMRADACRRSLAEALNSMALLGDSRTGVKTGIKGLFNLASTQSYTVPTNGSGSSKKWSDKSADNILADLFGMVDAIPNNTFDIEGGAGIPLNFVMPKSSLRLISTLRLGTSAQDTTVLEFFRRQRPSVKLMGANYLPTAGALSPSSTQTASRMVVYDPSQVQWLVSLPFEQMPVELKGFRFNVNCRSRGGGVITPYPKSIIYGDGT